MLERTRGPTEDRGSIPWKCVLCLLPWDHVYQVPQKGEGRWAPGVLDRSGASWRAELRPRAPSRQVPRPGGTILSPIHQEEPQVRVVQGTSKGQSCGAEPAGSGLGRGRGGGRGAVCAHDHHMANTVRTTHWRAFQSPSRLPDSHSSCSCTSHLGPGCGVQVSRTPGWEESLWPEGRALGRCQMPRRGSRLPPAPSLPPPLHPLDTTGTFILPFSLFYLYVCISPSHLVPQCTGLKLGSAVTNLKCH